MVRSDPAVTQVLVALPIVTVLAVGIVGASPDLTGDVALYRDVSGRILRGEVPYRDFELEYPAFSIVPMLLPRLALADAAPDLPIYDGAFVVLSAVLTGILALVLGRFAVTATSSAQRALAVLAILVALTAHVIAWRYDMTPALLSAAGILTLAAGSPTLGGAFVGVATAAKLYPAVLIPIGIVWLLGRRRPVDAMSFASAATAATVIPFLPFTLIAPEGAFSFLAFHAERGLQIESVTAGLLELGAIVGILPPVGAEFAFKSYQLTTPMAEVLLPIQAALTVALQLGLAGFLWLHLRDASHDHPPASCLIGYAVAALLAFLVTNKVLSPQYLVWLLALVPVISGVTVPLLVIAAAALTVVIFPMLYVGLIGLDPGAVLLLNLRNAALVGALGAAVMAHRPAFRRSALQTAPEPTASGPARE